GQRLAPLGTNRVLVADSYGTEATGLKNAVQIYQLNGKHLLEVRSPNNQLDWFGSAILALDEHRFLIGAPNAPVTYFTGNQFVTNNLAGAVYLYDDTGALLSTFTAPDPTRSRNFGSALSLLGPGRLLIGSALEKVNGVEAGRVHMFNLSGSYLASMDNPAPYGYDYFGGSIAALDDGRFVVGAQGDDNVSVDGGSVFGFDMTMPVVELGSEIPRPPGVDASAPFPSQGPTVTPADAAFWHVPSGKLFGVKPGQVLVSWPLLNHQTNNWQGLLAWPTNVNRYQSHLAGQATVEL